MASDASDIIADDGRNAGASQRCTVYHFDASTAYRLLPRRFRGVGTGAVRDTPLL